MADLFLLLSTFRPSCRPAKRRAQPNRSPILAIICFAALFVLLIPDTAQAYIGPGAGFAVAGSLLTMFAAFFAAILAFFTWPIRYIIRAVRGRHAFKNSRIKKFVILGLDGLDPGLAEQFMNEGLLPNLAKLREQGCFKRLATTTPSISPVAWSSFQTGVNPGKHNIFDFLTRDKRTYQPRLSSVDIRGPKRKINIGKYQFLLGKADIRLLRKGRQFWKTLGEHGIFSHVIRVPITFPPEKFYGVSLSGMCVPDLRGSQGMFSFYTTRDNDNDPSTGGENYHISRQGNTIKTELVGSENPLRKDKSVLKCPFAVTIKDETSASIKINGDSYTLEKNVYTPWINVDFKAGPGMKIRGICKFLLLSTAPEFELYVTPINIDPEKPVMPIAHPGIYSAYLAKRQGPFATLGLAEDSWALNEKILSDDGFLQQCVQIDQEREKMFFDSLDKVKHGLCVCVFDGTDRIQHAFWRQIDKEHPIHQEGRGQSKDAIKQLYRRMDDLAARTLEKCKGKDTIFMIISDHGFNSFRYGVDLNRWLEDNDYLTVRQGRRDEQYLQSVDWSQTQAFAVGLSGIFLNLKGRESQGIVDPGAQAAQLRREIAEKLCQLTDPARGQQKAIKQVYNSLEIYCGPYKDEAPDLLVGYNKGYRASWETAIGRVTDEVFHDNTKAWSGDHCIDPQLVPGVLFCNRPIATDNPRLMDIGPTVLDMFGVMVPGYMDGKPLTIADLEPDKGKTKTGSKDISHGRQ